MKKVDITLKTKVEAKKWAEKRRKQGLKVRVTPFKRSGFKTRYSVIIRGSRKRRKR